MLHWRKAGYHGMHALAGHGDLGSAFTTYGYFPTHNPDEDDPNIKIEGYDLWVWSGPAETMHGLMGADLRSMRRARRLGWYPNQAAARAATRQFHAASSQKQIFKITYPNGKIYVGMDLTGSPLYFGVPSAADQIAADHRLDASALTFTLRKEVLWESVTATAAEVRAKERELIITTGANNPNIGYNMVPRFKSN
jgi:hypothetical protein